MLKRQMGLNPCCSGQWSNIGRGGTQAQGSRVLILIVVDDGLVLNGDISKWDVSKVS